MSTDNIKTSGEHNSEASLTKKFQSEQGLNKKYKEKGVQAMTLSEYQALESRRKKKFRLKIPGFVKMTLSVPFILVFCFGIFFFIPFLILQVVSGSSKKQELNQKTVESSSAKNNSDGNASR